MSDRPEIELYRDIVEIAHSELPYIERLLLFILALRSANVRPSTNELYSLIGYTFPEATEFSDAIEIQLITNQFLSNQTFNPLNPHPQSTTNQETQTQPLQSTQTTETSQTTPETLNTQDTQNTQNE